KGRHSRARGEAPGDLGGSSEESPRENRPLLGKNWVHLPNPRHLICSLLLILCQACWLPAHTAEAAVVCAADCDGSGAVTVDELVLLTNLALGTAPASMCASADANGDGQIGIDELLAAVSRALNGCPLPLASIAGPVQATVRALSDLPALELLISAAFSFAG